jgi:hypothetical protein
MAMILWDKILPTTIKEMDILKEYLWKLSYDTKAISEIIYCSVGSSNRGNSDNLPLNVNNMRYVHKYLVNEYSSWKVFQT